jgi:penicillin-binding protein 2
MNRLALKDSYYESRIYATRSVIAILIVLLLMAILVSRYISLQVTDYETYRTQSDRNRVQLQSLPPKRGLIYDRRGELLAENRPSYTLSLVRERIPDFDAVLTELNSLLAVSKTDVERYKKRLYRRRPYEAVPLRFKLNEQEIAILAVNGYRLPGVEVDAELVRHYPSGELFSHAIGYVGRINEIEQFEIDGLKYRGTHHIGKVGIEKYYEDLLHGSVGYQNVETNAMGRVLRVLERTDPLPGADLTLFLDSEVQRVALDALGKKRGSIVAIDPLTGGIIAMVSTPGFDANLFTNGISTLDYNALRDSLDLPLFNRSVQGQYPPGSTIKQIWALAGLHYGLITPEWNVRDPGWYQLPNDERRYRDWKKQGHGDRVSLKTSIEQSCDVYYYELAYKLGIDRMHEFATSFGLGSTSGIDISSESEGLLPSREWKQLTHRLPWFPGETVNIGIGQGYMLMTPLQLALATATIANKGLRPTPRLVKAINGQALTPGPVERIDIDEQYWQVIHEAMAAVVHGAKGTANRINRELAYRMAGKTGTAQVVGVKQGEEYDAKSVALRNRDHGMFVAFAPLNNPTIAVAVVVENGEHGSWVAPLARRVIDAHMKLKSG